MYSRSFNCAKGLCNSRNSIIQISNQFRCIRLYNTDRFLNLIQTLKKDKGKIFLFFKDDTTKSWKQLRFMEKASRMVSISLKLSIIILGVVVLSLASYSLGSYLFVVEAPAINTSLEYIKNNEEVSRNLIEEINNSQCKRLLGNNIKVFSGSFQNSIRRNSYIPSQRIIEPDGREQLIMRFYVRGDKSEGEVGLKMIRKTSEESFQYQYLYLDVMVDNSLQRIWLIDVNKVKNETKKNNFLLRFWGLR
ncbi:hypothetical protein T552_03077 [Pneumocystis carinii B80]|uniref:Mitochondrial import inner membrane translocase subunit Tim21 n=1 Tax=Pneumocystis carinii (strain B80) TaxID=1408658 RepID=A0A0W4ZCY5_PNEC8|nr:hypothetical protein T552_03077 [Pneumocystis carinii B80]KTW26186.1 hypothetical protein T552_03077 [Pneumocystis carinii B80]